MTNSLRQKEWPIEIVDLPIEDGGFPVRKLLSYQRVYVKSTRNVEFKAHLP